MYPFYYLNSIFFQFKFFAFEVSFAGFEVNKRQFNLFSGNYLLHLEVKEIEIERIE